MLFGLVKVSLFSILGIILQVSNLGSRYRIISSCNYAQDWLFCFPSFIGMCNLLFILHLNKPCIQVLDCKLACVSELKNSDFPAGTGSMFSSHLSGPWPRQAASRFIIDTEL